MIEFTDKQECLDWLVNNYESAPRAIYNHKRDWSYDFGLALTDSDIIEAFKNKHTDLDSKQQLEQRVVESFGGIAVKDDDLIVWGRIDPDFDAVEINQEQPTFKADELTVDGVTLKVKRSSFEVADALQRSSGGALNSGDIAHCHSGDVKETINERSANYGKFEVNSKVMQSMKDAAKSGLSWDKMSSYQKEAVEMILHKIGRIVCGDPDYIDSWHDIAGYAKLVEDILDSEKRTVELNDAEVE